MTLATVTKAARTQQEASEQYREALGLERELAEQRRKSFDAYVEALLAAFTAGYSYAEIARAAGSSRQAVYQLIERRTR